MNAVFRKRNEVRTDVREIRADNKTLRDKIDHLYTVLSAGLAALRDKIDDGFRAHDAKFDAVNEKLTKMSNDIAGLRGMQKAMLWVMGLLGTLAMILITAAGKALHWF